MEISAGRERERNRISCCDVVNRGAFYADGKIIYNLLDGHTVAVEANSGRELWNTQIADLGNGEDHGDHGTPGSQGSRIVGASGGEFGYYGWVKGPDLKSGRRLDRAQHRSGCDVLARAGTFKPPYDSGVDLGARSWANDSWQTGGAPVWGSISYDPELDSSITARATLAL